MYSRIIVAADGSENSLRAAKEAIKIALLSGGTPVEVIHVADFDKAKYDVLHARDKEELELKRRRKLSVIEQAFADSRLSYQVKILHGEPGPALVEYATREKADLIVIGNRGLNVLQEMVMGSVSHKVVKRSHCPVLVVK